MKKIYQTQQRKQLLDFLTLHKETQYTIEEIIEEMQQADAPAKSSIYRLMKQLVEEGKVKRYVKDHSRQFVYEYIAGENCSYHFHLKCFECGRLIHLSETTSQLTQESVAKEAGFIVDKEKSILFGICDVCQKSKA